MIGYFFASLFLVAQFRSNPVVLECRFVYPIMQAFLSQHIQYSDLSPQLEKRTIEQIIKRYDPFKIYFLKSDYQEIEKALTGIFENVKKKNCESLKVVQNIYSKRLKERLDFVKSELSDPQFQLDKNIEVNLDREKVLPPGSKKEIENYLKQYIQFQLANYIVADTPLPEAKQNVIKNWERNLKKANEAKEEELLANFLDSFSRSLDPHSSFMPRDVNEDFKIQMSLSLQGIGATLSSQDGFTVIENLVPGGPAAKSGLLEVGDRIVAVGQGEDGPMESVIDMELRDVVRKIRGPKGTKVRLTILRKTPEGKKTFTVALVRDEIKLEDEAAQLHIQDIENNGKKYKIGIIQLPSFYNDGRRGGRSAYKDVQQLLLKAKAQNVNGILLDLSTNGGGSLDDAVRIAGLFIRKGPIVKQTTRDDPEGNSSILSDDDSQVVWSGPLVVFVSSISASASEIVAGALQDYKRAVIVGAQHTFGKGTVQTVVDIPPLTGDLGAIKVTVGIFYVPSGYSTQHRGVLSDVVIPTKYDSDDFVEKKLDYSLTARVLSPFLSPEAYVKDGADAWKPIQPEWIDQLKQSSLKRQQNDQALQKLVQDLEKTRKNGKRIKIGELLSESKNNDEKKNRTKRSNDQRVQDYLNRPDLKEAGLVLADLVEILRK